LHLLPITSQAQCFGPAAFADTKHAKASVCAGDDYTATQTVVSWQNGDITSREHRIAD
jgi:hypothetical protein